MTDVAGRGTGPRGPGAIVRIVNLYYRRLLHTKLIQYFVSLFTNSDDVSLNPKHYFECSPNEVMAITGNFSIDGAATITAAAQHPAANEQSPCAAITLEYVCPLRWLHGAIVVASVTEMIAAIVATIAALVVCCSAACCDPEFHENQLNK